MVFFLYAVSGLLVLGGFALALYGADNIRTDSGAVFAATGVSALAAGLLLLATTRVLTELRKIRVALEDGLARGVPVAPAAAPVVVAPAPPADPVASTRPLVDMDDAQRELDLAPPAAGAMAASAAATAGAAVAGGLAEQLLQRSRRRDEPEPPQGGAPGSPDRTFEEAVERRIDEDEDLLRDVDAAGRMPEPPAGQAPPRPGEAAPEPAFTDLLDEDMARGVEDVAARDAESAMPAAPEPVGEASEPMPARPAERTLAATYASGENTYFMYSDGTIEAETPIGRFRFVSMDELRVFVETGEGGIPLSPPAPPGAA